MIAIPVRSIAAQFVLAIVLGCSASIAHALVYFPGLGGYDQVGQGIVFVADAIVNDDATHSSQPLRMELWAFPSPFPSADPDTSYRLAQVELQALPPGGQYTNYMSSVQPLGSLPNGTWYISVLLTEFVESGFDDGYAVDDWISFPDPVLIGPSQGVQPIIEYYYAASNTFFITGIASEITALDSGQFPGWERTGFQFFGYDLAIATLRHRCGLPVLQRLFRHDQLAFLCAAWPGLRRHDREVSRLASRVVRRVQHEGAGRRAAIALRARSPFTSCSTTAWAARPTTATRSARTCETR